MSGMVIGYGRGVHSAVQLHLSPIVEFGQQGWSNQWLAHWLSRGFSAVEAWLENADTGKFCHGDAPGLADCFLVPQVYNAERFSCDMNPYPNIRRISAQCRDLAAFQSASPEQQPDAPGN